MSTYILRLQIASSLVFGAALFGPPLVGLLFADQGGLLLRYVLVRLANEDMLEGHVWDTTCVANYAFLTGVLFSLGAGRSVEDPGSILPHTLPIVSARHMVGAAFDQGVRQSFTWPPIPSTAMTGLVSPHLVYGLGLPLLLGLCVVSAVSPVRALLRVQRAVEVGGPRGGVRQTTASQRAREWLEDVGDMACDTLRPALEWTVDTIAPFFFGVTLVMTTSVGIVLYGVGHVGVARATQAGWSGMDLGGVRALVWRTWRVLFRLDWVWGWRTLFGLQRRHRERQQRYMQRAERYSERHSHSDASGPGSECDCPRRHLGDHLHTCSRHHLLHRHDCGCNDRHEHHGWHWRHRSEEQERLERQEHQEEQELRRELLAELKQRRGVVESQTDGSSGGHDYQDNSTQTDSIDTPCWDSPCLSPRMSTPSPELGEMSPRPLRAKAESETGSEAEEWVSWGQSWEAQAEPLETLGPLEPLQPSRATGMANDSW